MRTWRIPFGGLEIGDDSRALLNDSADRDWASEGQHVRQFEERWGGLFDYKQNIMITSGTTADIIACEVLHSLNSKRSKNLGDNQVIVPALAFSAAGASVIYAGFEPVFVDVQKETMNIDPGLIEREITDKTRALLVINPNNPTGAVYREKVLKEIVDIAGEYDIPLIADEIYDRLAFDQKFIGMASLAKDVPLFVLHFFLSLI